MAQETVELKFPFQVLCKDIPGIIASFRSFAEKGVRFSISYPESPQEGGWLPRPYSRGGPSVFMTVIAPAILSGEVRAFLDLHLKEYT